MESFAPKHACRSPQSAVTSTDGSCTFPRNPRLLRPFGGLEVGCGREPRSDLETLSPSLPPIWLDPAEFHRDKSQTLFRPFQKGARCRIVGGSASPWNVKKLGR